jgi:hypothetical protein
VLRIFGQLAATTVKLAERVMRALRNASRPSAVAGGFVSDLTCSRSELIAENAFLRQQLIVASRGVKRPAFRGHERGLLVVLARLLPRWRCALLLVKPETVLRWHRAGFRLFWRNSPALPVRASRAWPERSSPSSSEWRPRTAFGEPSAFVANS